MFKHLLTLFVMLCLGHTLKAQIISNEGRDFYVVFPMHSPSTLLELANITVYVTAKAQTEATVSCGNYSKTSIIPANKAVAFDIPREAAYLAHEEVNRVIKDKSIRIQVSPNNPPVSVYAHIWAGMRSAASLILPFESFSSKYYAMNYDNHVNYLVLVAQKDNTDILIHENAKSIKRIHLPKAGDVYQYTNPEMQDLTGLKIEVDPSTSGCKNFAVFSGTDQSTIGCIGSADPLYQQLYPTKSWGKNYGVVPFRGRNYILRIVAQEDQTEVKIGDTSMVLQAGAFYQSKNMKAASFVSSNKAISVAQYALTEACNESYGLEGDPEMVILNPVEFNITHITLFSSELQKINNKYVNIFIPSANRESFTLNGKALLHKEWKTLAAKPEYSYAQIEVFDKNIILNADVGFNAIAYGFGKYESYAYSAGTNLAGSNALTVVNTRSKAEHMNGCVNTPLNFKITLPYVADRLVWKHIESGEEFTQNNPVSIRQVVNNQQLYEYTLEWNKTHEQTGTYHFQVQASVPATAENCESGVFDFNFEYSIFPLPTAAFETEVNRCLGQTLSFKDKSSSNDPGRSISEWLWDFGDGTQSTAQEPQHQYKNPGIYTLSLMVKSDIGCFSEVKTMELKVFDAPKPAFEIPLRACVGQEVVLKDLSTLNPSVFQSRILKWIWDMGDGQLIERNNGEAFTFKYDTPGQKTISLQLLSSDGCMTEVLAQQITIYALPVVAFDLPMHCLADGTALFENRSQLDAALQNGTSYLWTYMQQDGQVLGTSTEKDGSFRFAQTGHYKLRLELNSIAGCALSLTKDFTVNGQLLKADFEIENKSDCRNNRLLLRDKSELSFGQLSRIELYKDYARNATNPLIIENPAQQNIELLYDSFEGKQSKEVEILYRAYSGLECMAEVRKIVTLYPRPEIAFELPDRLCLEQGLVLLQTAKVLNEVAGKGVYSGKGMRADGTFNPKEAGPGMHIIHYTFKSDYGCEVIASDSIEVSQAPDILMDAEMYLEANEHLPIPVELKSYGKGVMQYKWTNGQYLDRDDVLNPKVLLSPSMSQNISFTLRVTTEAGCVAEKSILLRVLAELQIPNVFSPNGDGVNDTWNLEQLKAYLNLSVEIFNRQGNRVFYSTDYTQAFDGRYQGKILPQGVYYYVIKSSFKQKTFKGALTILR